MINLRMLKLSDKTIWLCMLFLVIVGFLAVFSSTCKVGINNRYDAFYYLIKQFWALIVGFLGMIFFAYIDYDHLKKIVIPLYVGVLLLLFYVLSHGASAYGAQRWIDLGPFSFQPSEITKLVVIITLAAYFNKVKNRFRAIPSLLISGIPFLLIFKQPDLGTALVIIAISLGMIIWDSSSPIVLTMISTPIISLVFRGNIFIWLIYLFVLWGVLYFSRVKFFDLLSIMLLNIFVGIAFPIVWGLLREYQRMRIITFLNPSLDPHGLGYHTLQSIIATGSGGFFGKGFLSGTQTQLHFIPEQHSDFIYSVITEEFGFIGAILVLIALVLLIRRILIIAEEARDYFGGLLACGISVMLLFHVFVSIGMVVGVMPVVGIPLPFISFGGTALIVDMILIGIVQSIAMRRRSLIF